MSEAPRLLHVFPGFGIGGAQIRFAAVANRLGDRYQHLVVSLDGSLHARERLAPDLDIAFPRSPWPGGTSLGGLTAIRRFLRVTAPGLLVTHNWGSMDWAIANFGLRLPHIHIEDGFGPEERTAQLPRRVMTRRLVLRRSTLVLPSRTLEHIAREAWRIPADRVRYIPNGVDLDRFRAPPDRGLAARFEGEGPLIGTIAALRPEKNLSRLLRAFAAVTKHDPARLVIVGDGPDRAELETLAARLGIAPCVFFPGYIKEPAPFYGCCEVFALSSDTEQMPISVLEAMAAGLPIAATDVGDVRNMVSIDNGPFVVGLSDDALAAALRTLTADAMLRTRIGEANRAKAERVFNQEAMFASYADLFETVRAGARAGPASQARAA
jgi:glycosyltransferase involved in cell wall biosynthesis